MEIPSAAFYYDLAAKVRLLLESILKKEYWHIVYTYNILTLY